MKKFFVYISTVIIATSCVQENLFSNLFEDRHSFEVEAILNPAEEDEAWIDTKAYAASYSSPSWASGDKISVVNLTTGKVLGGQLSTDNTGYTAKFNGTVTGTVSAGDRIAFVYPPMDNNAEADYEPQVYNLSVQNGSDNVKMIAISESTAQSSDTQFVNLSMNFTYQMSYMRVNIATLPASTVASSFVVNNINDIMTLNIKSDNSAFEPVYSQSEEGTITVTGGTYTVNKEGTLTWKLAVFSSPAEENRDMIVTIGDKQYVANFTAAQLSPNKYYNTIVSNFREVLPPSEDDYGIYQADGTEICLCKQTRDQIIITYDNGKIDFAIVNPVASSFVKVYSIPSDLKVGDKFTSVISSNGVDELDDYKQETFTVENIGKIGSYTKYWLKSANYQFVFKK